METDSIDRVIFATDTVRVGAFRCAVDHPRFRDSGPIQDSVVVFPRRAVWIRQRGSRPLVADPRVVTIYNKGRRYDRGAVSADGDKCDWFALAPEAAVALAREVDPSAPDEPERAFRPEAATSDLALYLRQRRLFLALQRGTIDRLAAEEEVLSLVESVLRRASGRQAAPAKPLSSARRDLVERTKAEIARDPSGPTDLTTLSKAVGSSPSHLCRVFRQGTGLKLHEYRVDLRLRSALESLGKPAIPLSQLAIELGFASHSHFTSILRRRYGVTPSKCREMLARGNETRVISLSA